MVNSLRLTSDSERTLVYVCILSKLGNSAKVLHKTSTNGEGITVLTDAVFLAEDTMVCRIDEAEEEEAGEEEGEEDVGGDAPSCQTSARAMSGLCGPRHLPEKCYQDE